MADTATAPVEIKYFAAAAEAAGTDSETVDLPVGATVAHLRAMLGERYGGSMTRIASVAVFLIGDEMVREDGREIGLRVDVLPPFAGG